MSLPELERRYCAGDSEENVEIVRRAYAALAEEGVEAMLAFTDPQFEMTAPSSLASEPDIYRRARWG